MQIWASNFWQCLRSLRTKTSPGCRNWVRRTGVCLPLVLSRFLCFLENMEERSSCVLSSAFLLKACGVSACVQRKCFFLVSCTMTSIRLKYMYWMVCDKSQKQVHASLDFCSEFSISFWTWSDHSNMTSPRLQHKRPKHQREQPWMFWTASPKSCLPTQFWTRWELLGTKPVRISFIYFHAQSSTLWESLFVDFGRHGVRVTWEILLAFSCRGCHLATFLFCLSLPVSADLKTIWHFRQIRLHVLFHCMQWVEEVFKSALKLYIQQKMNCLGGGVLFVYHKRQRS